MGYDRSAASTCARGSGIGLGETTADGRFTLLPVACLGACDHAPAMMIDDDLHGDLTPEKIDDDPRNGTSRARQMERPLTENIRPGEEPLDLAGLRAGRRLPGRCARRC